MSAAKWHREQARAGSAQAKAGREVAIGYYKRKSDLDRKLAAADRKDAVAAHHATAADALEALAVGRLSTWIGRMASADAVYGSTMTDKERAALATLAKIGKEGK